VTVAGVPVVILAGGRGARFDHESQVLPKPLIKVAGKPMLQHIIDSLALQGFREFIVAAGYLGNAIRRHFEEAGDDAVSCPRIDDPQPWHWVYTLAGGMLRVTVVDTGQDAHTGLRLWRVREHIAGRRFVLTYGDGLSDVGMHAVLRQHELTGAAVTMTAVHPPSRFGLIRFAPHSGSSGAVASFDEKPSGGWINGGFMVVEPEFIEQYIEGEFELESTALRELAASGGLHAYRYTGYWRCMDTRRDLEQIEADVAAAGGRLPWLRDDHNKR